MKDSTIVEIYFAIANTSLGFVCIIRNIFFAFDHLSERRKSGRGRTTSRIYIPSRASVYGRGEKSMGAAEGELPRRRSNKR